MNPFCYLSPQKAPGASRGIVGRGGSRPERPSAPRAFTLVELLVVIGIIGLLAALLTPVVMQSLTKARNAAIKAEIDMLHMAIMNYKNEYGSFPPARDLVMNAASPAGRHLARIFPRCPSNAIQAQLAGPFSSGSPLITDTNAMYFWLSGFTSDPTSPLIGTRTKLFDFDGSRVNSATGSYAPAGKPLSPYLYIDSAFYPTVPYDVVNTPSVPGAFRQTYRGDLSPFTNVNPESNDWFNASSFQILCAGRDEQFGTDDDLSNFWPGTRREYLDSLKD